MSKGLLLVLSGPSGVGKGTICKKLIDDYDDTRFSVSMTTRENRKGEIDGVHYRFISKEEFEKNIENGCFLEYADVFGMNYYGTPKDFVDAEMAKGHVVIVDIDVQGAAKVKKTRPDSVSVFIEPPSMEELKRRLVGRGTETPEKIEKRTATAFEEMKRKDEYDYSVINDTVDSACKKVRAIIDSELAKRN